MRVIGCTRAGGFGRASMRLGGRCRRRTLPGRRIRVVDSRRAIVCVYGRGLCLEIVNPLLLLTRQFLCLIGETYQPPSTRRARLHQGRQARQGLDVGWSGVLKSRGCGRQVAGFLARGFRQPRGPTRRLARSLDRPAGRGDSGLARSGWLQWSQQVVVSRKVVPTVPTLSQSVWDGRNLLSLCWKSSFSIVPFVPFVPAGFA